YLRPLYDAECSVALHMCSLNQGAHPLPKVDSASALRWVERRMGIELAETQKQAIDQATRSKVMVITGGPGVGKTTIVRGLLEIFAAKGLRCALCAPTGRAAKRLQETKRREAKTIHLLLEVYRWSGRVLRDSTNRVNVYLFIMGETYMVDISLMNYLVR